MDKLTNKELSDILFYCATLARLVSPNDAMRYFGFTFDGAVVDTLRELSLIYEKDGDIQDIKSDELYGSVLKLIISDVKNLLNE